MIRLSTKIFALLFLIFAFSGISFSQQSSIYELPAGTLLVVSMDNGINSQVSSVNDRFTATVIEPVMIRGAIVVPIGSVIEGSVEAVKRAASPNKNGSLVVKFDRLRFRSGEERNIDADLAKTLKAETNFLFPVLSIAGGIGAGALMGSAVGRGGRGVVLGAGIGGGIGAAAGLLKKGRDVFIETDEKFSVKLRESVTLPVKDF